jgi:hypothetical protein
MNFPRFERRPEQNLQPDQGANRLVFRVRARANNSQRVVMASHV